MTLNTCSNCGFVRKRPNSRRKCPVCGAIMPTLEELEMLSSAMEILEESRFDEAKAAFENIIFHYPDNAQAYWGRLRARYHISHRTDGFGNSFLSCPTRSGVNILEDCDYVKAMTCAKYKEKNDMREQAERIKNACTPSGLSKNRVDRFTFGEVDPNDAFVIKEEAEKRRIAEEKRRTEAQREKSRKLIKRSAVSAAAVFVLIFALFWFGVIPMYSGIGLQFRSNGNGTFRVNSIGKCKDTAIVIPSEYLGMPVTNIGDYAFEGCSSLTSIVIPDSVTSISANAFRGCSSLTSIDIPGSVTSIGDDAFDGCWSLYVVYNNSDLQLSFNSTDRGYVMNYVKMIVDKNGNKTYKNDAYIDTTDGFLFKKENDSYTLIAYFGGEETVTLPTDVNGSSYTIDQMIGVRNVIIPDGVTSIGNSAFYGCTSLTGIVIPDSVTSIGSYAFEDCSRLTSMTLPFVGSTANGTSNTHFGYIFGASSYSNNSSYVPPSLKTVVITGGSSIGSGAFSGCSRLTSIEIPDSVTSIGERAFSSCSSLTSIEIPDGVTSIGDYAFRGCSGLTSIVIPDSVTSIGVLAFYGCSSLTSIVTPDRVTSIGDSAFLDCSSLTSIEIPDGVTSIGNYTFYDCSSLTSIVIPDSVTSIGYDAFYRCSSLTSIEIPDSVTSIGRSAFYGCSSLTSIQFGGTVAQWKAISFGFGWNSNTGNYTVTCTDGTVAKDGTITRN